MITPCVAPGHEHVFHQYTIRVPGDGRDALAEHLRQKGVGTMIYYPVPVHKQKVYVDMGYRDHLPASEQASREVLSLPVHPALTTADLDKIVEGVNFR